MNIIKATVLRNHLSDSLKEVKEKKDFMLIAKRGKVNTAIVNLDLFEDLLELADNKYLASVRKARVEYEKGQVFSHDEVFGDL